MKDIKWQKSVPTIGEDIMFKIADGGGCFIGHLAVGFMCDSAARIICLYECVVCWVPLKEVLELIE